MLHSSLCRFIWKLREADKRHSHVPNHFLSVHYLNSIDISIDIPLSMVLNSQVSDIFENKIFFVQIYVTVRTIWRSNMSLMQDSLLLRLIKSFWNIWLKDNLSVKASLFIVFSQTRNLGAGPWLYFCQHILIWHLKFSANLNLTALTELQWVTMMGLSGRLASAQESYTSFL